MSINRGLFWSTVMSLLVPTRPGNQCQQYRSWSTMASQLIVASFPALGLWYWPFNTLGQFFQCKCMQSTQPIQLVNPSFSYFFATDLSSEIAGGRLSNWGPKLRFKLRKNSSKYWRWDSELIRAISSSCLNDRPVASFRIAHCIFWWLECSCEPNAFVRIRKRGSLATKRACTLLYKDKGRWKTSRKHEGR